MYVHNNNTRGLMICRCVEVPIRMELNETDETPTRTSCERIDVCRLNHGRPDIFKD